MKTSPLGKMYSLWKARALFANPAKLVRVFRDKRTPLLARILPIIALVYVFFPLDIMPDFIPILGQIDDMMVALSLLAFALSKVPVDVLKSVGFDTTTHVSD